MDGSTWEQSHGYSGGRGTGHKLLDDDQVEVILKKGLQPYEFYGPPLNVISGAVPICENSIQKHEGCTSSRGKIFPSS